MGAWEDMLSRSVHKVNKPMHILILILNIFFPGVGTMISACLSGGSNLTYTLVIGLIQFFTAGCLIGWIWSIYWGILIF